METHTSRDRGALDRLRAYAKLGKLRLSALAVFAVAAGLYLGARGELATSMVAACIGGTMLVAIGGSALNMFAEREYDRRMHRTRDRPLPAGRLYPGEVLAFGLVTSGAGLLWLWLETNALATAVCAAIVVTYVAVYTPLKRVTALNTLVGAVPGALPPLVGYAASHGSLDRQAMVLFLILFFWQIPHFLAIAWRHRDDYERGGMLMLPVVDPGGHSTSRQMVAYAGALFTVSLAAYFVGLAGQLYLVAAICLGLLFLTPVVMAAVFRVESAMRLCFLASIGYLPMLLGIMVLDRGST